jgi:hypothetical protein
LRVEAGATVVFCPDASLQVHGSLRVEGKASAPVTFRAQDPRAAAGSWRGVTVHADSGTAAVVRHLDMMDVVDGITVLSASPVLEDVAVSRASGRAFSFSGGDPVLVNATATDVDTGLSGSATRPFVSGLTVTNATAGVSLAGGGTFQDVRIDESGTGFVLTDATVSVDRLTVTGSLDVAVGLTRTSGLLQDLTVQGGATSLRVRESTSLVFESATFTGANSRALDVALSTAVLRNTTVSAPGVDFLLVAADVHMVNGTFDPADRLTAGSTLWDEEFLHVRAVEPTGEPIPGATARLTGVPDPWEADTGADGTLRWTTAPFLVVHTNGTAVPYAPLLNVTADGFDPVDNDRTLSPGAAGWQTFTLRRTSTTPPDADPLLPSFAATVDNLTVAFEDRSTPTTDSILASWSWRFGDGGTSGAPSPLHQYDAPGTYTVRLEVTDTSGAKAAVVGNVTVSLPPSPPGGNGPSDGTGDALFDPVPALLALSVLTAAVFLLFLLLGPWWRARRQAAKVGRMSFEPGRGYVISGRKPDAAYRAFHREVEGGARGLVISRASPEQLRKDHGLGDVPVRRLGRTGGSETLRPTNLGAVLDAIVKHLKAGERGIVLLDGMEYLLAQNPYPSVVRFMHRLAEVLPAHGGVAILPFHLESVSLKKEALLTRDLEVV